MSQGLPTETALARKLWRVSRILQCSPFSPELLHHNEAQLDFILESYYRDHPKEGKFFRGGYSAGERETIAAKTWADVLMGQGLQKFMARHMPNPKVLARLRSMAGSPSGSQLRKRKS